MRAFDYPVAGSDKGQNTAKASSTAARQAALEAASRVFAGQGSVRGDDVGPHVIAAARRFEEYLEAGE